MAEVPSTPTPASLEQIALQIKSLEQRTTSVTLSRNASVLELKQEIQLAFDVDSDRQRLIFQGRVLKDDKHLSDYANLDDGKVVHLVVRPVDAPHNPLNDEPNSGTRNRTSSRSRLFPSISGRFPMMEGYAFITLDSHFSDMGSNRSLLPSMLSGFSRNIDTLSNPGYRNAERPSRTTTSFTFGRSGDATANRSTTSLPFPPSVEVRLARTLGSIRNVRHILDEQSNVSQSSTTQSSPDQLREIRNRLRSSGNNQSSQIAMVLRELTDVMQQSVPRMREVSTLLTEEDRPTSQQPSDRNRVQNLSRIIQGMSLINHFLGSVLASADIENMRRAHPTSPLTTPIMTSNRTRLARGNTEAVRTSTPPPVTQSPSTVAEPSSSSTTVKRKNSSDQESSSSEKKPRNEKGKDKDKHV